MCGPVVGKYVWTYCRQVCVDLLYASMCGPIVGKYVWTYCRQVCVDLL